MTRHTPARFPEPHLMQSRLLYVGLGCLVRTSTLELEDGREAVAEEFAELTTPGYKRQRVRFGEPEVLDGVCVVRNIRAVTFPGIDPLEVTHLCIKTKRRNGRTAATAAIVRDDKTGDDRTRTYLPPGMLIVEVEADATKA